MEGYCEDCYRPAVAEALFEDEEWRPVCSEHVGGYAKIRVRVRVRRRRS